MLSFCAVPILTSCQQEGLPDHPKVLVFSDSFFVSGIELGQQVQNMQYLQDTLLLSYNFGTNELVYFPKRDHTSNYEAGLHYPIATGIMSSLFLGEDQQQYFIGRDNRISIYRPFNSRRQSEKPLKHSFRHLKDSFAIISSHTTPVIVKGDTLISFFAHNSFTAYPLQFEENSIAEFSMKGDTLRFIRSYLPRPAAISRQYAPFAKYCYRNNTLHLVYPGIDTIYSYDRRSGQAYTTAIHNPDFVPPAPWDLEQVLKPSYSSYYTHYTLSNFSYEAFHYNPDTRHYLLFYSPPIDTLHYHQHMPTPQDKAMMILVMDEQFQALDRYMVTRSDMVDCVSCFYMPGKGFAWPRFQGPDKFHTTTFYRFNL